MRLASLGEYCDDFIAFNLFLSGYRSAGQEDVRVQVGRDIMSGNFHHLPDGAPCTARSPGRHQAAAIFVPAPHARSVGDRQNPGTYRGEAVPMMQTAKLRNRDNSTA